MPRLLYLLLLFTSFCSAQNIKEVIIHSKELHQDRKLWISTPPNYNLRRDSFHVVIVLDGNNRTLFDYTVACKRFIENNSVDLSDYKTPEAIVVGVEQAADRRIDFGDSAGSARFSSFLSKELIPFVQANYRTINYRILIGHSLAGRFAINFLLNYPNLFNAVIAASPAFSEKNVEQIKSEFDNFFKAGISTDKALYFSTTYLKGDGTEEGFRRFSEELKTYFESKPQTNFRFRFNSSTTLGHGKSPYFSIPEGIHFIYDPALWQLSVDSLFAKNSSPIDAVEKYRQRIKRMFGVSVSVHPFAAIMADQLQKEGKSPEAIRLLEQEVYLQPDDLNLYIQLLTTLKKNNSPEYSVYQAKLKEIFRQLNTKKTEQTEWLKSVNKNSP